MPSLSNAARTELAAALALPLLCAPVFAQTGSVQPGTVEGQLFITEGQGGFTGDLVRWDSFGHSVASLGDLDFDGVADLAVGCPNFLPEPVFEGRTFSSLYVLFLHPDGTVREHRRITEGQSGFTGDLSSLGHFGSAIAPLGDLDGDGVTDIAVGEQSGDGLPPAFGAGAVWILFLNPDGTVKPEHRKIAFQADGFGTPLRHGDNFGISLVSLGDLDGDGAPELAVGASGDDGLAAAPAQANVGAVHVLFLNPDGTVKKSNRIAMGSSGFAGPLAPGDFFGTSLARVPSLDGDPFPELLVGAPGDDDGGPNRGAVWRLHLDPLGNVVLQEKISSTSGNLPSPLADFDSFGRSLSGIGDLDGDGFPQVVVGAPGEDNLSDNEGALHVLFLDAAGNVTGEQKVSTVEGDFTQPAPTEAPLRASALAVVEDLDADGVDELAVGTIPTSPSGEDHGAVWMLFVDGQPSPVPLGATACDGARLHLRSPRVRVGGAVELELTGLPGRVAPGALAVVARAGSLASGPCGAPLPRSPGGLVTAGPWFGSPASLRATVPALPSLADVPLLLGGWLVGADLAASNTVRVVPRAH